MVEDKSSGYYSGWRKAGGSFDSATSEAGISLV